MNSSRDDVERDEVVLTRWDDVMPDEWIGVDIMIPGEQIGVGVDVDIKERAGASRHRMRLDWYKKKGGEPGPPDSAKDVRLIKSARVHRILVGEEAMGDNDEPDIGWRRDKV